TGLEDSSIPIGQPIANTRIHVLDAHGQLAPAGVAGELHIAGVQLARGYLNRPDLTAERFVPDPFGAPGSRMYRSGDLARWRIGNDGDGTLEYLGRNDHQVKVRGFRIELGEIEAALSACAGVREAVVLARGEGADKQLVAYVTGDVPGGEDVQAQALREQLASRLPEYMVPAAYVQLQALPLTPNGKLDRRALPAPGDAAYGTRAFEPPLGPIEETLAEIWQDLLGLERIGRADNFYHKGGQSLLAMQVVSRVRRDLGVEVRLGELFEHPTLVAFATRVAAAKTTEMRAIARADRSKPLPLSFAQQRLWFLGQLDERAAAAYVMANGVRLHGPIKVEALQRALDRIVERHEVLRTCITVEGGEPQQLVREQAPFQLARISLAGEDDAQARLQALIEHEGSRPFDLEHGPLIRGCLVHLADDDHALLVAMHHIVSDGWSFGLLLNELTGLYAAFVQSRPDPLPPLALQYADHAAWQRQWLSDERLKPQIDFWATQLDGVPTLLGLATDHPRPALQQYDGDRVAVELDAELVARLRALGERQGTTLFMTVLAAWTTLLSRLSGQTDLVIGTPAAGRTRSETEPLIGLFVNTLALRLDTSGTPTVAELLARVRATVLAAQDHQDLPFEQVIEAAHPERSLAHTPLFQVMFSWTNTPRESLVMPGLQLAALPAPAATAPFDLSLDLQEAGNVIVGNLTYATALFERPTIERQLDALVVLLRAFADADAQGIGRLPLVAPAEQQRLATLYATARPLPLRGCVHELFAEQAVATPDAIAVIDGQRELTYAELAAHAAVLAARLRSCGVGRGSFVATLLPRSAELIVAQLAVLQAEAAYVPLDPQAPAVRHAQLAAACDAIVVLHADGAAPDWTERPCLAVTLGGEEALPATALPAATSRALAPACAIYTSGSTGVPKAVLIPHQAIVNFVFGGEHADLTAFDRVAFLANPAFDASTYEVWAPLVHGAAVVVVDHATLLDPTALAALLAARRVSVLHLTAGLLNSHRRALAPVLRTLRCLLTGGDRVDPAAVAAILADSAPQRLLHCYGPTETTTFALAHAVTEKAALQALLPMGTPLANMQIHVLDPHAQPLPQGATGEIHIGGLGVALGYLHAPALTAERFVPDPFADAPGRRLYKTGDLGRWRSDGTLEFLGRADEQVKIRGFRIELGEVEFALRGCAGVRDAVAVMRGRSAADKHIVAYVTGDGLRPDALREQLAARLPDVMVPAAFVELTALPLTRNGKVDRAALPEAPGQVAAAPAYEAPIGPVEETLARLWAELLAVPRVGRQDNFFALGGHSMLAIPLLERMRAEGLPAEVRAMFAAPTLAALAALISEGHSAPTHVVPPNLLTPETTAITPEMLPLATLSQASIDRIVAAVPGGVANVQDIYGLSPLQEGILFHHLLDREADPYLTSFQLGFNSRASLDRYLGAMQAASERHDILRTALSWQGIEEPVQVVWRQAPLRVTQVELDAEAGPALPQLEQWCEKHAGVFDVTQAPLFGCFVARDPASNGWLLRIVLHHLAGDHTTMEVISAEIAETLAGRTSPAPAVPFRNLVAHARLSAGTAAHEPFFARMLGDIRTTCAPFGLLQAPRQAQDIRHTHERLSAELVLRVRQAARSAGVSVATLAHVAWALVVSRTSGQREAVFGTVLFGRMHGAAGIERSVGLFMNTLPLRLTVDRTPVALAVARAHALLAELLDHEHAPLALAQRVSGVTPPAPLFTSLLNYRHNADTPQAVADAPSDFQFIGSEDRTSYPLALAIEDFGHDLGLTVHTPPALAPQRVCALMRTALEALCAALEHTPDHALDSLDVMAPAELDERRLACQAAERELAPHCVHTLFEQRVAQTPNAPAVAAAGVAYTYAQLNARANRLARHLLDLGVGPEVRVALCVQRGAQAVVAMLAVLKAGGAFVPLDPAHPQARLLSTLEDCAPHLLLADAAGVAALPDAVQPAVCRVDDDVAWSRRHAGNLDLRTTRARPRRLAYLIYTSGSTGLPKAAMLEHQALCNLASAQQRGFAVSPDSRVLQFASLAFDASVSEIFVTLLAGATLVVPPAAPALIGDALHAYLEEHAITHVTLPPAVLADIPADPKPASLQTLVTAGEALPEALARRWAGALHLVNAYGPTETTVCATMQSLGVDDRGTPRIGRAIDNTHIHILDARGRPVPVHVAGEIHVGGIAVARGYLNRPDLTAERFVPDPYASEPGARLYRTGDLGRWHDDGTIEFLGRTDDQLKLRGHRIEPAEVETAIAALPGVHAAAVRADAEAAQLVAYVVAKAGSSVSLWPSVAEFFVYDELLYHAMTHDERRNAAYLEALRAQVQGKVVLDIGTGQDAILARLAVQAGARKVYAVELLQRSYDKARSTIDSLGLADRIELIHGNVLDVQLPEPVDVCVSEIVGAIGGSEGAAVLLDDARRFLKPGGAMIPSRSLTMIGAVALPESLVDEPHFTGTARHYVQTIFEQVGYPFDLRLSVKGLTPADLVSDVDVFEDLPFDHGPVGSAYSRSIRLTMQRSARLGGLLLWLRLETMPGVSIDALAHEHCWLPVYLPAFEPPLQVAPGDVIEAEIIGELCHNGLNPDYHVRGELRTRDGAFPISYSSFHDRRTFRSNPFYARLFDADGSMARDVAPQRISAQDLRRDLGARLPAYMMPSRFVFLESLPLTPNGKVDRRALPLHADAAYATQAYEAPQPGVEEAMAELWSQLLGARRIGRRDNFFELGGHSLLAVQLISRLRTAFDVEVALADVFAQPTLLQLAQHVLQAAPSETTRIDLADRGAPLPLSFAQQRLWFLEQLDEHARLAYLMPSGLRLVGPLDESALVRALDRILARHEVLRTGFVRQGDGSTAQVIAPEDVGLPLLRADLTASADPQAEARRHAQEEAATAFDLSRGPLIRARLLKLAEQEHVLLLTMHHIVSDGWSMGVLINEFSALYAAFSQAQPDPLPALPIQYADYAVWQRRWLAGDVLHRQLDFWRDHLQGAPALLELPTDRPRPPVQDFTGASIGFELDQADSAALQALAARHGATLHMVLLAAWAVLLARLSGQADVVIGTPVANRTRAEVEPLIGFFVNTLALRVDLSGHPTVAQLVEQVKASALAAQAHQDVPFEQVIEALNPERSMVHSALFQVIFTWQNAPEGALELPGLALQGFGTPGNAVKFDLDITMHQAGTSIGGSIGYATALFERPTIERWARHFEVLLQALVADEARPVAELPLLDAEQHGELERFNATDTAYPQEQCIHALFEAQAQRTPDAVALVFEDESLSYAELDARANRLAHHLQSLGVGPDARVALLL
ncbi:amino acid adenylation domain-containing protein, partial [Variovorax boronicumulans]|uniref:amino acid adenylation domain-containing protein n=1 Tax=Variovorax boronicumulans TaxID=436515 RepID=UPI0033969B7E